MRMVHALADERHREDEEGEGEQPVDHLHVEERRPKHPVRGREEALVGHLAKAEDDDGSDDAAVVAHEARHVAALPPLDVELLASRGGRGSNVVVVDQLLRNLRLSVVELGLARCLRLDHFLHLLAVGDAVERAVGDVEPHVLEGEDLLLAAKGLLGLEQVRGAIEQAAAQHLERVDPGRVEARVRRRALADVHLLVLHLSEPRSLEAAPHLDGNLDGGDDRRDELEALEGEDESHQLELVLAVDEEEDERKDEDVDAAERDQLDGEDRCVDRVLRHLPDGRVRRLRRVQHLGAQPRVDIVPTKRRRLSPLLEPQLAVRLVGSPVRRHDPRLEVHAHLVPDLGHDVVHDAGDAPRHVWRLGRLLCDAAGLVDDLRELRLEDLVVLLVDLCESS
mmetsp:Transcript_48303/g.160067  ORF Transcript_48303/g.160067 Transcript_48303/m.160067 type:complete len:393 (-) Transcript_48303:343-1521(-)